MYYFIMNKDSVLIKLETTTNSADTFKVVKVFGNFPVSTDNATINRWIQCRESPFSRKNMQALYAAAGIGTDLDYVNKTKALSLNDTFWIKSEVDMISWDDINPYKLPFNKIVSDIAFGSGYCNGKVVATSPEYGTGGTYAKCWKRVNGEIFLIKQGHEKWSEITGNESFSEYFTCQVAKALHITSYTKYALGTHNSRTISACKLFTDESWGFRAMSSFGGERDIFDIIRILKDFNSDFLFRQMLLLDCLVYNIDRHSGNYGVLVNNDSFKVLGMSPIFDNNLALLPTLQLKGKSRDFILSYLKTQLPKTMSGTFLDQAVRIMTPDLYKSLIPLQTFEFKQHDKIKFDQERLDFLSAFVRHNAKQILKTCKELS